MIALIQVVVAMCGNLVPGRAGREMPRPPVTAVTHGPVGCAALHGTPARGSRVSAADPEAEEPMNKTLTALAALLAFAAPARPQRRPTGPPPGYPIDRHH